MSARRRRSSVARLEHAKRATTDEIEGVRHDRVHTVLVEAHLDDRTAAGATTRCARWWSSPVRKPGS